MQEADTVYVHTPLTEVLVKSTGALLSLPQLLGVDLNNEPLPYRQCRLTFSSLCIC